MNKSKGHEYDNGNNGRLAVNFRELAGIYKPQRCHYVKGGESIPFANFMISEGLILIERDGPDAAGTRRAILSYDSISVVKLATNTELSNFMAMGFRQSF